jgi:hypothetical protein
MASCMSWTVEINGGGFVPAGAPMLKSVQVQREELENNVPDSSVKRSIYKAPSAWPTVTLLGRIEHPKFG